MNLTRRQLEVWEAVASGKPRRQSAAKLGISYKTFEVHLEALKHRLRVRGNETSVILTRMWIENDRSGPDSVC